MGQALRAGCLLAVLWLAGCGPSGSPQQQTLDSAERLRLADAAAQSGNDVTAQSLYARVAVDPAATVPQVIGAADGLVHYGDVEHARVALEMRLQKAPNNSDLNHAMLRLRVISGDAAIAIADADRLLAHDPQDEAAVADKAVALDLLGRHDEAQALYRLALIRTPDDDALRTDLALSQLLSGKTAEAKAQLQSFASRNDAPQRARTMLALVYEAEGDAADARPLLGDDVDESEVAVLAQALRTRTGGGPN